MALLFVGHRQGVYQGSHWDDVGVALPHGKPRGVGACTQIFYKPDINLTIFSFQTSLPLMFFMAQLFQVGNNGIFCPSEKAVVSPLPKYVVQGSLLFSWK